jgi:hypothetical protein
MKTTMLKSTLLIALTAGLFTSCVKDDNYSTPQLNDCGGTTLVANRQVAQITANATVAQHVNIVDGVSDVIEAYVTSSDMGGNFFKSISFQTKDGSKAFSMPVDATNTFIDYEPGRKVLIKMDGLYTDNPTSGPIGMRIGSLYVSTSGFPSVGRMTEADFRKAAQPSCTKINEDELLPATPVTIDQLKSDTYLNRLVELNNVMFDDASLESPTYYNSGNDLGGATNLHIIDLVGGSVIVRTSSYANFAAKSVPKGSGKMRGVLTKYGTDYQFIVRTQSDVKLSNDIQTRFTPLLNEGFDSATNFSKWTAVSVIGAQVWNYSSTFGNPGGMAKMSGFATTNNANEDWLISPKQNLSALANATLSFDNAYKFTGDPIQVLISNNYPGTGSPNAAGVTWTPLTANLSTGNYVYANSGNINISTFTGSGNSAVYVAFKYTSSSSAGSTWEIDNVKITTN